ncbi:MAG TPA: hypothetical protein VFQ76_14350, partial [Longimicrobiaceae bacterium]|nr:hypothetical protein [Longimicrobiaceae bacterium]
KLNAAEEETKATTHRGSIVYFLLYTIAGITFLLGDLVMSKAIVADSLNLRGPTPFGIDESWLFALGLAMISVLLKPAYDRLVEDRYVAGEATRRFTWTILIVSAGAILTVGVLGWFRATSFQMNVLAKAQPAQANSLWTQLATNPLGTASFVLSGLLFAVAGAVCLGIGLRHGRDWRHIRSRLTREQKDLRDRCSDLDASAHALDTARHEAAKHLLETEAAARSAPAVATLETELDRARHERRDLLERHREARRRKLDHLYQDGYQLGYIGTTSERKHSRQRRPFLAVRRTLRLEALKQALHTIL